MTDGVEVTSRGRYLPSAFDVDGPAVTSVCSALLGAAELAEARGRRRPALDLDAGHVACAFASERHLRRPGKPLSPPFACLSRFARTHDGWIRLHANYPHHRRALLEVLSTGEERAFEAIEEWRAEELESDRSSSRRLRLLPPDAPTATSRSSHRREHWTACPCTGLTPAAQAGRAGGTEPRGAYA